MESKKHRRKKTYVILVTSDIADEKERQLRIRSWLLYLFIFIICTLIGITVGYIMYKNRMWGTSNQKILAQQEIVEELEEQKKALETELDSLNDKVKILSETVNQKVQTESELTAQLEKQETPTEFPLTGSAAVQEITEGDPICVFTASVGTLVVATANGTVTAVGGDSEYGYYVWIDHGNGYTTIYRNQGDMNVNMGDTVKQGQTLFIISENNTILGYQMLRDGAYINPMDMLSISG